MVSLDEGLDLEDLKLKLSQGCKVIVVSRYRHSTSPLEGLDIERGQEGELVEITDEDRGQYDYFVNEAGVEPSKLPPIGTYQYRVNFGHGIGVYKWSYLHDPGFCELHPQFDKTDLRNFDPNSVEKMFSLKRIEYPENPKQLKFKF